MNIYYDEVLKGKVAVITGAGRGIGKAIAIAYTNAGADVVCAARTEAASKGNYYHGLKNIDFDIKRALVQKNSTRRMHMAELKDPNRQNWNRQFKILQDIWPKPDNFETCIEICMNIHAMVHAAEMYNTGLWSFEDELWERMSEPAFRKVHNDDQSIAWKLWHSTRIEDITMNILIAGEPQILYSGNWLEKMGISVHDTGNAMNEREIDAFSNLIDMQALRDYRLAVGRKTRNIIKSLKTEDLKKRVEAEKLQRIREEGAVVEEARWLIDYWGKKTFSGLLLMPATRHNLVHLNESMRILGKDKSRARGK